MVERGWLFLKNAGTIILAISIVLWVLTTYPKHPNPDATATEQIAHSFAGQAGHVLEPVSAERAEELLEWIAGLSGPRGRGSLAISTTEAQAAVRLGRFRLPVCITAGAQWTDYDYTAHESTEWSAADPDYRIERHRIGGGYQRLRVPVGISLGREFNPGWGISLVPYVQPTVVFERERLTPAGDAPQTRMGMGLGLNGGLAVAKDWFVLRANLTHTGTHDRALSSRNNVPSLSVHAGVRF